MSEKSIKDLELWHSWNSNPTSQTLQELMQHINPVIRSEANKWKHTNINPVVLESRAQELAFDGLRTFNPDKGVQLNTHLTNHLQKLNRFAIENQNALRIQENKVFEHRKFNRAIEDLEDQLGRKPTSIEIKSHLGVGDKISEFQPTIEHFYSKNVEGGGKAPIREELSTEATALAILHGQLTPQQRSVMEKAYGYHVEYGPGYRKSMKGKDIAKSMGISQAMVSKHLKRVDQRFQEHRNAADAQQNL